MIDLNKVMLIGRLGQNPKLTYANNGTKIVKFSMATNRKTRDGTQPDWHNIVAFGKLGEICEEYLFKGRKIYIEGRLETKKFEKDGQKHYRTSIIMNDFCFLDKKQDPSPLSVESLNGLEEFNYEDDIPF